MNKSALPVVLLMKMTALTLLLNSQAYSAIEAVDATSVDKALNESTAQDILQRQVTMEAEMRRLTGRIEELEHKLALKAATTEVSSNKKPLKNSSEKSLVSGPIALKSDGTRDLAPSEDSVLTTTHEKYRKARDLITARQYEEASTLLKEVTHESPKSILSIDAYYWLGEIHFINGKHEGAAVYFGDSYKIYEYLKTSNPEVRASKAPNSLIQLARCLNKLGKKEKAMATLKQLEKEFPNPTRKIVAIMAQRARQEINVSRTSKAHA